MIRPIVFGFLVVFAPAFAQHSLFDQACATCHNRTGNQGAPPYSALVQLPPEAIYRALTTGKMQLQAASLSDEAKRGMAEFLSGRKLDTAQIMSAKAMSNPCQSNPPIRDISFSPAWNGWGVDVMNTRFQLSKPAGFSPDQAQNLKLKWAFGFPGASTPYGLPSVVAGRVFIGVDTGNVYSIDAATGCVYWSFQAEASVRTAVSVGLVVGKPIAYFGDQKGNAYAIDAGTGELFWRVNVESHPLARITGSPTLYRGRLYVPVASEEESAGTLDNYECCTFRGSVVALDAATGRQIWKTYTIQEAFGQVRKNSKGVQLWGPAGAGIWSAPTIDPKRNALYVATGDAYTEPASKGSDAVVAMSLNTGKILWSFQEQENDAWLGRCGVPLGQEGVPGMAVTGPLHENCPKHPGPDNDFGQSPVLKTLPNGRRILVVAQRSGDVFTHDPDRKGARMWKADLGSLTLWGGAADDNNIYYGTKKGVTSLRLSDGRPAWVTTLKEHGGNDAAVSAMPGLVFSGRWDGMIHALSTETGRVVWEYNTAQEFKTVNGIAARGGSAPSAGPTIANGMLFVGSGYFGINSGMPGNVLLAFSVK